MSGENKPVKKSNRGGARIGAGRKSIREEANLLAMLKPYESEAVEVLVKLVRGGDIQAVKLYFAYLAGNPTTTTNSNIQAVVTNINIRDIISFGGDDGTDDIDFEEVEDDDESL